MKRRRGAQGFSLIEVVVAVAVFAIAVVSVLLVLPTLARQTSESADLLVVQGLPSAIRSEMKRLAASGFDAFAASLPVMMPAPTEGYRMVGARDGVRLTSLTADNGEVSESEHYFLIELWRFNAPPLGFVGGQNGALAVHVRVSWPYRLPGAANATGLAEREQVTFAIAINR
jgi:prepilin-type N-terminal cleavage/methylation domain-containing protein